jgi:eukaryotic-like serine/threonine-protein kinase
VSLNPGSRFGAYEVTAAIGEGGMGKVFRAHDTGLHRDVALKVLPESFAGDGDRLSRFDREAQVLASLNHPNIAHLYGIEDEGATRALVMELVSGPTLAERLEAGPIPIAEALAIARQIADALEAAHERGIVHRDLKPANVKVRDDGVVKVLDFGLAKALDPVVATGSANLAHSPTFTAIGTQVGMILGTAAYMSPEQAKGKPVDKRADIWAFGVVLYEMLAGRLMFSRENVTETLAQVILKEPDWKALPPDVPPRVRDLLARCLVRDPRQRLRDIGDARIAIDEALQEPAAASAGPVGAGSRRRELAFGALAFVFMVTTAGALVWSRPRAAPAAPTVRFEVVPPSGTRPQPGSRWIEMSPDGRHLAFTGTPASPGIFVRSLDTPAVRLLVPAELLGAQPVTFFWSPDSESIAFFADRKLHAMPAGGGTSRVIGSLPPARMYTGTWGTQGVILFVTLNDRTSGLWRVPAAGGNPAPVMEESAAERVGSPVFLPDGRHYVALRRIGDPQLGDQRTEGFVGVLDSPERQLLLTRVDSPIRYVAPGYLVFARDGDLVGQQFDLGRRQVSGEAFTIAPQIAEAPFGASTNGTLAFRAGGPLQNSTLAWFDRTGKRLRTEAMSGNIQAPSLSRDGKQVVVERTDAAGTDLWSIDLVRGTSTRLTDDQAPDDRPVLSPDGTQIVFTRNQKIVRKFSSGIGAEEVLADGETTDWSPDGKYLSFIRGGDLWALPLNGDKTPRRLVETKGNDRRGRFSPDGKWIAYESNFSGRFEVYVQRFPPTAERVQVSVDGGGSAFWRSDGKELFFSAPDQTVMAVAITPGDTFQASAPQKLFEVPGIINNGRFVVMPDGQQFLLPVQRAESSAITVVLNWPSSVAK